MENSVLNLWACANSGWLVSGLHYSPLSIRPFGVGANYMVGAGAADLGDEAVGEIGQSRR